MKKAKYNEVPKEYRRNYKKEIMNLLTILAFDSVFVAFLMWILLFH